MLLYSSPLTLIVVTLSNLILVLLTFAYFLPIGVTGMYYFPPIMTGGPGTNLLPPNVTGLATLTGSTD
jgi:hypothetical protein